MREMSIAALALCMVVASVSTGRAAAPQARGEGWFLRHRPSPGLAELGLHAGAFFPRNHELYGPRVAYEPLRSAGPELGLRFAYYPLAALGLELESAVMPTRTTITDSPATVVAARGHLIAQLPYRLAPFVLVGYGALVQSSRRLGNDLDSALHYGGGLKLFLTRWVALRLDLRANATGQHGSTGGRTQHLEALVGVSVTLGRRADPRNQAVPQDRCRANATNTCADVEGPRP